MRSLAWLAILCATSCGPAAPCPPPTEGLGFPAIRRDHQLDLLLMVDGSRNMSVPQERLVAALPRLLELVTTGDLNGDGDLDDLGDFRPLVDVNVAVVTADLGTGGATVPTCPDPDFGEDGIFRSSGSLSTPGCMATYPSFLNYNALLGASVDDFVSDVGCVARVGDRGCGFSQPLESILKALSPSAPASWTADGYAAPTFFRNTFGHADTNNDGFHRPGALLVIVHLSNDDDCSALDPALYDPAPGSRYDGTELALRCFAYQDALHPLDRYVDGLIQLRPFTSRIIYVPIVGIPEDLQPGEASFDALVHADPAVRDDRMEPRIDPASSNRLLPSCSSAGTFDAFPPLRTVRVARDLAARGASVVVGSICSDSYEPVMQRIAERIGETVGHLCFGRRPPRAADGSVDCTLLLSRSAPATCDDIEGAVLVETDDPEEVRCELPQLRPTPADRSAGRAPTGEGWYVDDYSIGALEHCNADGTITGSFRTSGIADGSLSLECRPPVDRPCDPACEIDGLVCDPVDDVCEISCRDDFDCAFSGEGYICDVRPLETIDRSRFEGDVTPRGICVHPSCGARLRDRPRE